MHLLEASFVILAETAPNIFQANLLEQMLVELAANYC